MTDYLQFAEQQTLDCYNQKWSRGHNLRGQGQGLKKIQGQGPTFLGQTLWRPRTGMLEAKYLGHKFSKI